MDSQVVTVRDAADLLGVHAETIRRWIRDGELSAHMVRLGRPGYRIAADDLERVRREIGAARG